VTLSTSFRSIVRGKHEPKRAALLPAVLSSWSKLLEPARVAIPAPVLRDATVAQWVKEHYVAVDIRTTAQLSVAVSAGVHPDLMVLHAGGLDVFDIGAEVALGVGTVVVDAKEQIADLARQQPLRPQNALLRLRDANVDGPGFASYSREAEAAVEALFAQRNLNLVGVFCDVGTSTGDYVSNSAAIGDMIAQLDHIRRGFGAVLDRVWLGCARTAFAGAADVALGHIGAEIDEAVEDACETLRFPRPAVSLVLAPLSDREYLP
jgi:diaminopimelate decarboxylase